MQCFLNNLINNPKKILINEKNKMFCVECGRETEIFKDGLCKKCYLKNNHFTEGPEKIDLPICPHCGAYKYKNTWTSKIQNEVLIKIIKNVFKISRELKKVDINPVCNDTDDGLKCRVIISGFIDDEEINEEHDLIVNLKRTVCDVCSKRFGGYHEAIIQVRAESRNLTNEEIDNIVLSVENMVEHQRSKGNRGLFITDMGREHGGVDFFLSDKTAAQNITKKLFEEYGGEMKTSAKNIGMKDSKQIYRSTYLLRLPSFQKDDVVKISDSYYYVYSISGKKTHLIDIKNWEDKVFEIKDLQNLKVVGGEELIKEMIVISQKKDEIQLMNQKTYKMITLKKPSKEKMIGERIKIIKIDDDYFLFPKKISN